MKREDLKKLNLTDEQIDSIMGLHGADIESHKTKLTDLQAQFDAAQTQLTEANTAIEGFKKLKPEELQAAADEWKVKFETAQTEAQTQILSIKRSNALEKQLKETYKVKDVKSVKAHLDDQKIQFNEKDETFVGLDEQVKPVKEKHDYLFEGDKPAPRIVTGGNNQPVLGNAFVTAARKGAGLPEPTQGK